MDSTIAMVGAAAALVVACATVTAMLSKVASWRGSIESRLDTVEKRVDMADTKAEVRNEKLYRHIASEIKPVSAALQELRNELVRFMLDDARGKRNHDS